MIPVSASDILKLLDKAPEWMHLTSLPKRIAALEERVAALEAAARKAPHDTACPICGAEMKVLSAAPDPTFGRMGLQRLSRKCAGCGHTDAIQYDPVGRLKKG